MIYKLLVPAAVPGVEEIRVLEWHGQPGATFEVGDLVVELETHKAIVEARAGQKGVLREIKAGPGEWCEIGKVMAVFSDGDEEALPEDEAALSDLPMEFEVV